MKVTAVVPHWNRRDLLETLLPNLAAMGRRFDEVIVVDNGSTDGSAEYAEAHGARVIRLPRNVGFAGAVNRGIDAAQDPVWIAVLNNDVKLAPDWLERLLAAADRDGAWFATGKILSARQPDILDATFDAISRGACPLRCGAGRPDGPYWDKPRPIRMAPLTAALIRRDLFTEIGLLDERFESYLEDADFGLRCAVAGCAGVYEPSAVAWHLGSATWGAWNPDAVRLQSRNQVLLAAKHFQRQPRWPILAGQLLWGLVALRHGRGVSWIRGKWQGLRASGSVEAALHGAAAAVVGESEREIFEVQRQAGFDAYWRAYFWLSRPSW